MSDVVLGSIPAIRGNLTLRRRGNWDSRWVLDDVTENNGAPSGIVACTFWGESIAGFVLRGGAPYLQAQVQVIGGRGNITPEKTIEARDYRYASFAQIAREIVEDAGEVIAEDVLVGIDQQLVGWTRCAGPWLVELERLIGTRNDPDGVNDGTTWNVRLSDGQIEIRPPVEQDTVPALQMLADHITERKRIYKLDDETAGLVIKPGDRFEGIIADTVEYIVEQESLTVEVYYRPSVAPPGQALDRMVQAWQENWNMGHARYRETEIDPLGYYLGTVRGVRNNGDIDLQADDSRIGFVNDFPVFSGLPGWQITPVPKGPTFAGARGIFGWSGGDKSKKVCLAWASEPAAALDTATIEARTLIEWKAPTHRIIGKSEVVDGDQEVINGDDITEHDVGRGGTPIILPGSSLTSAGGAVNGFGTDCGFTLVALAGSTVSPGAIAQVTFARQFKKAPQSVSFGAQDAVSALVGLWASSLTASGMEISTAAPWAGGLRFSVIIKE